MKTHRRALLALAVFALAIVPAIAFAAAPSNDNFSAAMEIPAAGGTFTSTNVEASAETGEPDHAHSGFGALHSVWFKWTPSGTGGPTIVDTCGSGFNTRLAVYTGSSIDSLTPLVESDDIHRPGCDQDKFAQVSFGAAPGTTYLIAVDTSGGVPDDVSGPPQGQIKLLVDAPGEEPPAEQPPAEQPPADDGKTTRGTPVPGKAIEFETPRLSPNGTDFVHGLKVWFDLQDLEEQGLTSEVQITTAAAKATDSKSKTAWLREHGVGGEIIKGTIGIMRPDGSNYSPLEEESRYLLHTDQAHLRVALTVYNVDKDKQALADEKAELARVARERAEEARREAERKEAKSKCGPIAADKSPKQIQDEYFPTWKNPFYTYSDAIDVLSALGCDVMIEKYVSGKVAAPHSYVKDVLRTDAKLNTVFISLAQPRSHDFVFAIRENPTDFTDAVAKKQVPIDFEGHLTTTDKQLNRVTVQVIERASGRLVAGVPVTFVGKDGEPETTPTNGNGEVTFTARITGPPSNYRLSASYLDMEGWVNLRSSDHGEKAYTSMAGRFMRFTKSGWEDSDRQAFDFVKTLPIVPALMGTGKMQNVSEHPVISQAPVTKVQPSGAQITGPYNTVDMSPGSFAVIGAAPGLIASADPTKTAARPTARAGLSGSLEWLGGMMGSLGTAIDRGVANIRTALSSANQAAIAATANLIGQAGGNLISDKGLGVISTGGGNLIGQAGGNLISDKGLGVISVGGGNLIGQAGGNVISDNGLGVISTGGGNLMPMHGGRILSDNGLG